MDEPPAVVSLLAGNLDAYGYPATLLDLAARGWLRLAGPEAGPEVGPAGGSAPGPVMCVIVASPPRDQLTDTSSGYTSRSCPAPRAVATSRPGPCPEVSLARRART